MSAATAANPSMTYLRVENFYAALDAPQGSTATLNARRNDWKVHKNSCYTPEQMEQRRKEGHGGGDFTTS